MSKISVLVLGIEPTTIDFEDPAYSAFSSWSAETTQAGLDHDIRKLMEKGYDADLCLAPVQDLPAAVGAQLRAKTYHCVVIGAGVRTINKNFLLLEKIINVVFENAPNAKVCFNTKPDDSTEAVMRWVSPTGKGLDVQV